jgi:hypothetical protein
LEQGQTGGEGVEVGTCAGREWNGRPRSSTGIVTVNHVDSVFLVLTARSILDEDQRPEQLGHLAVGSRVPDSRPGRGRWVARS